MPAFVAKNDFQQNAALVIKEKRLQVCEAVGEGMERREEEGEEVEIMSIQYSYMKFPTISSTISYILIYEIPKYPNVLHQGTNEAQSLQEEIRKRTLEINGMSIPEQQNTMRSRK